LSFAAKALLCVLVAAATSGQTKNRRCNDEVLEGKHEHSPDIRFCFIESLIGLGKDQPKKFRTIISTTIDNCISKDPIQSGRTPPDGFKMSQGGMGR
jgi:hypothetical protein